jgi:hypothetical protein
MMDKEVSVAGQMEMVCDKDQRERPPTPGGLVSFSIRDFWRGDVGLDWSFIHEKAQQDQGGMRNFLITA